MTKTKDKNIQEAITRLPKIEFERVPETWGQCSNCYGYIYNGYAQCHGPDPDCVLHDYRYYEPMYRVKKSEGAVNEIY